MGVNVEPEPPRLPRWRKALIIALYATALGLLLFVVGSAFYGCWQVAHE